MESDCAWVRATAARVRHAPGGRIRPTRNSEARSHSYSGRSRKSELPEKRGRSSPGRRTFFASLRALHLQRQLRPFVGKESLSQSRLRSFVHDSKPATASARFARIISKSAGRIDCRYSHRNFNEVTSDCAPT